MRTPQRTNVHERPNPAVKRPADTCHRAATPRRILRRRLRIDRTSLQRTSSARRGSLSRVRFTACQAPVDVCTVARNADVCAALSRSGNTSYAAHAERACVYKAAHQPVAVNTRAAQQRAEHAHKRITLAKHVRSRPLHDTDKIYATTTSPRTPFRNRACVPPERVCQTCKTEDRAHGEYRHSANHTRTLT